MEASLRVFEIVCRTLLFLYYKISKCPFLAALTVCEGFVSSSVYMILSFQDLEK